MRKIAFFLCLILIINLFSGFGVMADVTVEPDVAAGQLHVAALNIYGRVFAGGDNTYGQSLTYGWKDIVSICAGKYFTAGLDKNGNVFVAGKCTNGDAIDTSALENIIQIAAGTDFLAALDREGKVYVVGDSGDIDVSAWTGIKKIACGSAHIIGLMESGKCVGSGEQSPSAVGIYSSIIDIYAGPYLTVLKKSTGELIPVGTGTYSNDSTEEGSKWKPESWENVADITISQGSNYNGVVTAVLEDGTVKTDAATDKTYWSAEIIEQAEALTDVKKVAVCRSFIYPFMVVLDKSNNISTIGAIDGNYENWENEIKTFDVTVKPIDIVENDKLIVQARSSMAFLLPDRSIKTLGNITLSSDFTGLKSLTAIKNANTTDTDFYFGINQDGKIITNFSGVDLSTWHGAVKVISGKWNGQDRLVTALRWDGRLAYSTDIDDTINTFDPALENVVDIVAGEFFTAGLTSDKKVVISNTSGNDLDVSDWTNIEKIYAGNKHLVGVDSDGKYHVAGGPELMITTVESWQGMTDIACGHNYTVGLNSEGKCEFAAQTATSYDALRGEIAKWSDIVRIYSGYNYVIGEKADGTYVYAKQLSTPDLTGIENVYYKDNDFLYHEKGNAKIVLDYCLENGRTAYMSFFDSSSNPVGFKKVILEGNGTRTAEEYTSEGAASSKMTFNAPTASELDYYYEHELKDKKITVNYCAKADKTAYITLFDESGEAIEFKKISLPKSEAFTTVSVNCSEDAAEYKLAFDTPTVSELSFYMEHKAENGKLTVNYCSDTEKTAYVTFFDGDGNAVEFGKITLPVSELYTEKTFDCNETATNCKISFAEPTARALGFYVEYEKTDGKAEINYCSDKARAAYVTFFDEKGRPVSYQKIILPQSEQMTKTEFDCTSECKISFDIMQASEISFYFEHKVEENEVVLNYCSDADRKMWLAFYNSDGDLADFVTVDFKAAAKETPLEYGCESAERYRLFVWENLKPVYGAEGNLR